MPDWAREVRARLSPLRLSPTREAEIVDELSQHLEDRWKELLAGGASPEEATRAALAEFQDTTLLSQRLAPLRQAHSTPAIAPAAPMGSMLSDVWLDLRYAARVFSKQPGFAAAAVLTLALGLGASTAIFSVLYGVLFKPLPFHEPERLVSLFHRAPGVNLAVMNQGPATYLTYRDNQQAFEAIGAWESNVVAVTGRDDPEQVEALSVTDTTLPLLGVHPARGRLFTAEDDSPGAPLRVVLTSGYWQRAFGGSENVIGQSLAIDGTAAEIIGVLPASFRFLRSEPAVLVPMQLDRATAFDGIEFDFQALARVKRGITLGQANADVERMIPSLPPVYDRLRLQPYVRPLADDVIGDIGRTLWILMAAVGVVLLIACGNVANLFLVRAERRQQELALRVALGASRGRVARALLSESVLLALGGGALGLAFAEAALGLLRRIAPAQLPRVDEIGIDVTVFLVTLSLSVLSGAFFGLFAVLKFATRDVMALKDGGRSASDAPGRHRARNTLVVAQVALALTLLIVSALMVRTFVAMRQVPPGFTRPDQVQTFRVAIPEGVIGESEQAVRTYQAIAERLAQVPGVASVGLSSSITMDGEDNTNPLYVEEFPVPADEMPPLRRFKSFAPGYFETLGNRLVAGRSITWTEIYERRPVVVISETLAREYWREPSRALGKRVRGNRRSPWREIVGVVGDERDDGLNHPATAIVYWPLLNGTYDVEAIAYAVRSNRVGTPGFVGELREAVWAVNANLPLAAVQTLDDIQAHSMAQTSFAMTMLGIAASVALLLGVVGVYGVMAYIATQRTREIGIRIALGAQAGDVRKMFLRYGLWLTVAGIALGIGVALMLTRAISALLFGVGPMDPTTYAVVSGALGAVALLATYLPARRASRVDPLIALRADV
jgi:predicted permease